MRGALGFQGRVGRGPRDFRVSGIGFGFILHKSLRENLHIHARGFPKTCLASPS